MYQQITIVGRLGGDPEMRYTASGKAVTTMRVAVDSGFGETRTTEWFGCVAWDRTAESCAQYLRKGSLVLMAGRMQTRSWDGKDGAKQYRTELIADRVQFLDGNGDRAARTTGDEQGDISPDELPF